MNGRLEFRIITQPYSEVYWGYFRRLVLGNSLTKHNKLTSFSYSVVNFSSPFPRLFEPGECTILLRELDLLHWTGVMMHIHPLKCVQWVV